jgi:prophage maintenance system killer protein
LRSPLEAVIDSISRTHPLLDGNKRLGVVATFVIFTMNDYCYIGTDNDADLADQAHQRNAAEERADTAGRHVGHGDC